MVAEGRVAESHSDYIARRVDGGDFASLSLFPRYLEIETVNACNARCPMCTIDDWDRRDGLMSDALYEKIAAEIGNHASDVKRVGLFRDGEPLLDKRLPQRVAMLKEREVEQVFISTNAALLTEDKAEQLLLAGIDEVLLSVDSLKPSVYEEIRKGLEFETVMANCLRFIELRDAMQSDCRIWMRMIRQQSNYKEWPEYEQFWRLRLNDTDRVEYRNLHNWGAQLVNFHPVAVADTSKPCVALWSLMVIFANGDVPLCNVDYNNRYPLGNLRDSTIAELWQSAEQNRRRKSHMDGDRDALKLCGNCTVWSEEANSERMAA